MARVSTYLNFQGTAEAAFNFYKTAFKTEFVPHRGRSIVRLGDLPSAPDHEPLTEKQKNMVLHVELPTLGDHAIMGTDADVSMRFVAVSGNNIHINLEPDTRRHAKQLFKALSAGGEVEVALSDMYWGAYFGCFKDKFGVHWMISTRGK